MKVNDRAFNNSEYPEVREAFNGVFDSIECYQADGAGNVSVHDNDSMPHKHAHTRIIHASTDDQQLTVALYASRSDVVAKIQALNSKMTETGRTPTDLPEAGSPEARELQESGRAIQVVVKQMLRPVKWQMAPESSGGRVRRILGVFGTKGAQPQVLEGAPRVIRFDPFDSRFAASAYLGWSPKKRRRICVALSGEPRHAVQQERAALAYPNWP